MVWGSCFDSDAGSACRQCSGSEGGQLHRVVRVEYNEALLGHPHVLARGRRRDGDITDGRYNQMINIWNNSGEGSVEWVLLANADRSSFALMVCNCC